MYRTLGLWLVVCSLALLSFAVCSRVRPSEAPAQTAESQNILEPEDTVLERGELLYQGNCQTCHGGATGGSMMDIPPRHNANGHTWHHPDAVLVNTVLNGSGAMGDMMRQMMDAPEGTPRMPAFKGKLSEEEVMAILAYIKTWWTEEQRRTQADVSRRYQEALDQQRGRQGISEESGG